MQSDNKPAIGSVSESIAAEVRSMQSDNKPALGLVGGGIAVEAMSVQSGSGQSCDAATEILQGKTRDIAFGPYAWRVLDVQEGRALLLSEEIVERRAYNDEFEPVTWKDCSLRKYLRNKFLQRFTPVQQEQMIEESIQNPDNLWYGTRGGETTPVKLFLLSLEEVDRYFGDSGDYHGERRKEWNGSKYVTKPEGYSFSNKHDSERMAKYKGEASWWWLRSPGGSSYYAATVSADGSVIDSGNAVDRSGGGVRPAFWLNLKS
jgi:hypothetical protein